MFVILNKSLLSLTHGSELCLENRSDMPPELHIFKGQIGDIVLEDPGTLHEFLIHQWWVQELLTRLRPKKDFY